MHLRGYPKYYVKDGKRRPVYYTADARDLAAMGWRPEEEKPSKVEKSTKAEKKPPTKLAEPLAVPVEKIEAEVVEDEGPESEKADEASLPDFEFMTKPELIKFAADHGEALNATDLKAELVEACKKLVRARDEDGRFRADDLSTPDINEAWTVG